MSALREDLLWRAIKAARNARTVLVPLDGSPADMDACDEAFLRAALNVIADSDP